MTFVVGFDQADQADVALVGGKGHNLIKLTAAQFPVPPGFVVTSDVYRLFADQIEWLAEAVRTFDFEDSVRLADQCAAVRSRMAEVSAPEPAAAAIRAGLTNLGTSAEASFAVRSSSTMEDLAQAAFAGQHDTFLNTHREDVLKRIRDCFISLWGDRAVLYRHHQGFPQLGARMAVVVQQQILCDRAGVGFSINPVSGELDRLVFDANFGLGESVVGGECEVDHFELDKKSLRVIARTIGHKERMVAPTPAGAEELPVPADQIDLPCLSDREICAVAELLLKVEAHYGWPQDIEWGWRSGRLYLFQSRAVTTLQPRYTRDESAERFPNPMTPLTWDFLSAVFRRSLAHSLELMGLPPLKEDWFKVFDHYVYGNQNAVDLLAAYRPLRATNLSELAGEIPDLRRRYAWVVDLPVRWARDLDRYLIRLGQLSAVPVEQLSAAELWQHIGKIQDAATEYFLPNIAISITQSFLHRLLHVLVTLAVGPERALPILDGLLSGCETKTAVVNRELHELAELARPNAALCRELAELGSRAFYESGRFERYAEFSRRFARLLEDHGHRELDMDYSQPTWSAAPWIVLDSITLLLRRPLEEDPAETARLQRLKFAQTEFAFLSGVPEPLRFFFRELIRLARTYTTLDDLEHYQTTRVNPVARRAGLALGQRLVEAGVLPEPVDVFCFHREELDKLVRDLPSADIVPWQELVDARKRSLRAARGTTPPWSAAQTIQPTYDSDGERVLRGLPGSPGQVTGSCFLVHGPEDFGRFPPGAVLVARTTNPTWTALFYSASGLITESGGPLSHGAVTAREMNLPAVMSIRGALSKLANGQTATVDGTHGTVVVGDETPGTAARTPT